MNDFQSINDIVNESVKNSSYITVVISSCIFILYTIIIRIIDYFKAKDKNKPLIEMANALKENTANIVKLNSVLDKTLQEAERQRVRHCEIAIEDGFRGFAYKIIQSCIQIIAHNNIKDNKDLIINNIHKLVSIEYYNLYASLSTYEINEINVANKLKEEWITEVVDNIVAIVFNKQSETARIAQLTNRLDLAINGYLTLVNNKIFNT